MFNVAVVAEADCIGCTACFTACPTGAIVGAAKYIHTVVPELCTGCNACVPVCPVPCITLQPWAEATHPLQGINAAAGQARVAHYTALMATPTTRTAATTATAPTHKLVALPPELAIKAAAARLKSAAKYKKMGPLKRPRGLMKS